MKEVNPKETTRAYAFEMWMNAPMPMVTLFKTLDVTNLVRTSRKNGLKFNMLICWCIGKAASGIKEFYMLPVGDKLVQYGSIAVNTIVANREGEVSSCDIPFSDSLKQFNGDYQRDIQQSVHNMGPIQTASVETDSDSLVPVPPHPDGRRPRCGILRQSAERNR